jgi:EAL domain-containing protein (putative c-di-GMP-specific phosphodiesterase class I)
MRRKVELQQEAAIGIKEEQFLLYFQPIVPADPASPISFEALLRWRHPSQGVLSPGQFDEIFEDAKLAAVVGDRVINMAVAQAEAWLARGQNFGQIAVNVTSADFAFGCLATRLRETLELHNVPASKMCIEVTERVFLGPGSAHVGEALQRITAMGAQIALDDFGTGYASLTHLKTFPIGRLKIDRSFVQDMLDNKESLSIVKAIVQLGNSLAIAVTAEGVENGDQFALLRSIGCGSFQGYLFSPPPPGRHFASRHRGRFSVRSVQFL